MKLSLTIAALLVLSGARDDSVALVYAPEEGTILKRVFEAEARYQLAELRLSFDGEQQTVPAELPEVSEGFVEHIAVTDQLRSVADGRATEVVRTFDELGQTSHATGREEDSASESPLEGRTVRFTWDGDSAYTVAADDDQELADGLAANLMEDMDLRLVLPSKEVEPGDEWELDPKLYLAFMWPSGLLAFHTAEQEPTDDAQSGSRQTIDRLEGTGSARLEEVREEDGVKVAVIHVELDVTTGSEHTFEADEEGEDAHPEITVASAIERKVSGTILWDLDHGHARSAELSCEASRVDSRTYSLMDDDGNEHEVEEAQVFEGTIQYSATIERD